MNKNTGFAKSWYCWMMISAIAVGACSKLLVFTQLREIRENLIDLDAMKVPFNAAHQIVISDTIAELRGANDQKLTFIEFGEKQRSGRSGVSNWDPAALVYVTVGLDAKPGVASVDDDGNAMVDDRGELGATGTDDRVLTPGDPGYEDAAAGKIEAMVLSRGAMRRVEGDAVIHGPGQVRIDLVDDDNRLISRFVDLVGPFD